MPPGKSWNFFVKFPGLGKSEKMSLVLEIYVQGPGKSWNLLGNNADAYAKIRA